MRSDVGSLRGWAHLETEPAAAYRCLLAASQRWCRNDLAHQLHFRFPLEDAL